MKSVHSKNAFTKDIVPKSQLNLASFLSNNFKMKLIQPSLTLVVIFCLLEFTVAPPPRLLDGQRWVEDPNCPLGGVHFIDDGATRCHCWGHQGYICEKPDTGTGEGGERAGRARGNNDNGEGNNNGGYGCPPSARICIINNNSNRNENTNQNKNKNGVNSNGGSDYLHYD